MYPSEPTTHVGSVRLRGNALNVRYRLKFCTLTFIHGGFGVAMSGDRLRSPLSALGVGANASVADTSSMDIRFYLDPDTQLPHIHGHGVSEDEVEDVLTRPGEDRPGTEGSRVALGQTRVGRYLRVIYVPDPEPNSVFVNTAYELTGKALTAYRRRRRRRPR